MATYRGQESKSAYDVGLRPPLVTWTIVKGDTAAFRVYTTDDNKDPLIIEDWNILCEFRRPDVANNIDQDSAGTIFTIVPAPTPNDQIGEFTVSLTAAQTIQLRTGDVFDVELSDADRVWTVCQGRMIVIEDVTD
jgi:hypothetical protein